MHRHSALYNEEFRWNKRLEALVARITADFIDNYDPHSKVSVVYSSLNLALCLFKKVSKQCQGRLPLN
jgi:hypothetical protein